MSGECDDTRSLPLFFPLKSGDCEICGKQHAVEKCPLTNGFTDYVRDSPSPSYARLTLPAGLEVRELSDCAKTVVATKSFSKGLKFGPFVAKTSALIDVRIEFPLKVFLSEEESVYLETYEEIFCNWMCLVLPASCPEEQNLICFQIKASIYFCSLRDIEKGEELRVWYAPYYADKMGVHSIPKLPDLIHSSDEEFQEIFESLQSGVEMQDHQYLPKLKKRRKPPKKLILGENCYCEVPPSDVLPGELLGAVSRREWKCSSCGQVEPNVAAYARHLMTHYHPPKRPPIRCPYCNRNFRKDGYNRQIHLEVCKRKKLKELTQHEVPNQLTPSRVTYAVIADDPNEAESLPVNKNDCESVLDTSLWDKSIICDNSNSINTNENNQITNNPKEIYDKTGDLHSESLPNCNVNYTLKETTASNKNINITNNEWNIVKQGDASVLTSSQTIKLGCPMKKTDMDKFDKTFKQTKTIEENLDENLLVKPHLNTPILDLCDDIDFHLTKSLDDIMNDDCTLEKSMHFTKNRSLDLFGDVESNLLASDIPNSQKSSLETTPLYSLEKNEFLQTDFASCNDVTDEERNRIVENLLCETNDKFFASDYEMTDGYGSENPDSRAKIGSQSKEKITKNDKRGRSKTGGDFKCDICGRCFTKPLYLYRHLRKHTGEFRCNTCFMVFARKENLQNHRLSCPSEADTQQTIRRVRVFCKFCRLQFHSLSTLQDHMDEHYCTGDKWKCKCTEESDSLDLFLNHKCLLNQPTKSCTKCGKKFNSPEEFVEHRNHPVLKARRKPISSFLCEICGAMSLTISGARTHRFSVHGERTHKCSKCGKAFTRLEKLTEHENRTHMNTHENLLWECLICSKRFCTEKLYNNHQKNVHSNPAFTCSFCDKKFRQKSNFQRHLKIHKQDTINCTLCDLKFPTDELLDSHLKLKHIGHIFKCDMCDKAFPVKWKLNLHIQKFHIEMYKCTYCKLDMKYKQSLKKHLITKHKDKMEEWDNPEGIKKMLWTYNTQQADLLMEKLMDVVSANSNPSLSEILQTAADHSMEEDNPNTNGNAETVERSDTQITRIEHLANTNFVTGENTHHQASFDIDILRSSDNGPHLVTVDGEVLSMPLAFVSDLPSSSSLITQGDQSSVGSGEETIVSCPVVLPEGYLLTLDNTLNTKQQPEENSKLINVSDYQAITEATTSAYVLTDESVTESNLQLQNNVLFYIVDTSITNATE